jgi:hypothetical protein
MAMEPDPVEEGARWADLPISVLTHIFDMILRAPTPHPDYLDGKLASWCSLFRTCRQWRLAVVETGVGVCLPKRINKRMDQWLRKVRFRCCAPCGPWSPFAPCGMPPLPSSRVFGSQHHS